MSQSSIRYIVRYGRGHKKLSKARCERQSRHYPTNSQIGNYVIKQSHCSVSDHIDPNTVHVSLLRYFSRIQSHREKLCSNFPNTVLRSTIIAHTCLTKFYIEQAMCPSSSQDRKQNAPAQNRLSTLKLSTRSFINLKAASFFAEIFIPRLF